MHRLSFFAALALVFGGTHALAECNNVGCVRPTDALEKLAKTAERTFSVMRVIQPANVFGFYDTGHYATEPVATPLPKKCGNAGCATPALEG